MKAKPRKKYAEGGMVDVPRLGIGAEESLALESSARRGEDLRALEREDFSTPEVPRRLTFGQAFAAARRAGLKEFTWNGGRYGTRLKGEGAAPTRKPAAKMAETTGPEIVVTAPRPKPAAAANPDGIVARIEQGLKKYSTPRPMFEDGPAVRKAAAERAIAMQRAARRAEFDKRVGLMQQVRAPKTLALKKGGPVKAPTDRDRSNMAALKKALKQK